MKTPIESTQVSEADGFLNAKEGRRHFVRKLGVAVPVILTIKSPSALAKQCVAPSAAASIALLNSRPDRQDFICTGGSPGFWKEASKTHPAEWATAGGEGLLFATVFGSGFPGMTLQQVMDLTGNEDTWQLGAHLCAAYLNWKMGWVPDGVLSLQDMKDMWAGRLGTYEPTAGVQWNGEQIVAYIITTFDHQ